MHHDIPEQRLSASEGERRVHRFEAEGAHLEMKGAERQTPELEAPLLVRPRVGQTRRRLYQRPGHGLALGGHLPRDPCRVVLVGDLDREDEGQERADHGTTSVEIGLYSRTLEWRRRAHTITDSWHADDLVTVPVL
ncbi:MAG: hypothetical protein DMD67_03935 [Gemmatimonadetes bacterium]|nr:MAG: hypothetical protein DMD67_03935 [Gemmatimonadota bacterium]